jgi:hypothetical protein
MKLYEISVEIGLIAGTGLQVALFGLVEHGNQNVSSPDQPNEFT